MVNGSIGKILVVDDEVELKNILVEALTTQGYEAAGFTSGEEALAALRREAFDVLLTDLMMPGMDGITLVKESLQIDPHIVCMMMTGQGTIQTAVDAMKEGAFDYVLKPFRLQTVLPVLTRAMNTRHMRLENLQLRETVAIYELGQTIAFTLDPQTVISKLADAALQQTDADEVSVLLPTSDGSDELYVAAVRGEKREKLLGERVPLEESISGWVARERESLILDGPIDDKRFRSLCPHPEIRSAISIPMQVAGKLVGTININALSRPRPFTLGQMKALTILASTAAAALESASLYRQVQHAEQNYRSIFENAVDGIFRATPDGTRFLSVNPAMAQMFGYDSPAEMAKAVVDITQQLGVKPERRDAALRRLSEQGELKHFEERVQRKDGSEIWISANVRAVFGAEDELLYLDGIVEDITGRKQTEKEQARLTAILQATTDMVATADLKGFVQYINHAGRKMLGLGEDDDVTNTRIADYHPEWAASIVTNVGIPAAIEGGFWSGETALLGRDGREISLSQVIIAHTAPDGTIEYLSTIGRDITDRKQAEAERLLIFEIIQGVITTPNLDELLKLIHRSISKLLYAENCFVALHDETINLIHFEYWVDKFDPVPPPHSPRKGFASYVLRTNQPLLLTEELKSRMYGSGEVEKSGRSSASWLGVPLRTPSRAIGVLVVQHYEDKNAYTRRDLEVLSAVGDQIALAIERKRAEKAMSDLRRELELTMNSMGEGVHRVDLKGNIVFENPAAARMLGWEVSELLGKDGHLTMHHTRPDGTPYPREDCPIYATFRDGVSRHVADEVFWRQDGTSFPVEYMTAPTRNDQNEIIAAVVTFSDITERKRAEERLAAQYVVTRALADSVTLAEATPKILRAICETLGWVWGALWIVDGEAGVLRCQEVWHDRSAKMSQFETASRELTFAPRVGLPGCVWADERPIWMPDILQDEKFFKGPITAKLNLHGALAVPILSGSSVVGVMEFFSKLIREPDSELLAMMATVSSQIGQFIERKRAEAKILSEQLFSESMINSLPGIFYLFDQTGKFLRWNKNFEQITGYSADEIARLSPLDLFVGEEKELIAQRIQEVFTTGASDAEAHLVSKSGQTTAYYFTGARIDSNGQPCLIGVGLDIAESKQAEEALRESEERYRDLVENAHDIIFSHDLHGKYTSVNRAAEQITGYTREECLSLNIADTIAPEHVSKAQEMLARKLAGEKVTAYEVELLAKDGKLIAVEVNTILILQDGVPVGVQGIARDVTERKQLENQLRQSQKLEAIGQLAGGIAHDFNNLLTAINGYSSLALQRIEGNTSVKNYLEEIKKAGDRAANLTRQLLAFGRKQILQPLPLNLNDTVTDMNKMLRRLIGEDIQLSAKLTSDLKRVKADPGQIEQVLVNLVVNARDAMPQGGSLTIETANAELGKEYASTHDGVHPGAFVVLAVSDTGTGMDEEVRRHIFEPFFTTKEKGKGTGLGLSTVYGIVKQSGGNISIYSEPNHGTTFKVYLPALDSAPESSEVRGVESSIPTGSETVLLVEDEEVVRGLARQILEDAGYRVLVAQQGEEAIRLCIEHAKEIHLLLTDVVMPGAGGKEVADRLGALRPGIKVLFMSGYTDEAIVHHGVLDSNVKFIQKPFSPAALARRVREVLDSNGKVSMV